jgi:hypothetical protein
MRIEEMNPKQLLERGKRLWKNYRKTNEWYDEQRRKQYYRCGICGRHESEFDQPLQVDHYHFKVFAHRSADGNWYAHTVLHTQEIVDAVQRTKKDAIAAVRERALPKSVRGLLCPGRYRGCNRLLGHVDNPQWLENARSYVLDPPAKKA